MMALLHCSKCDRVGHDRDHCPFFPEEREPHADAQLGDNVNHMDQVNIAISVDGAIVEQCQREIGWFYNHKIEISVDDIHFVLGKASGEGCNCLIYSFQKILPTSMFNVSFVRAELERRHAGRPTAIVRRDYLDLAMYWADIIDIIGEHNEQGRISKWSSRFRICCVEMCWIGNGDVLPRGVPQGDRQTLYIARVNQNHFVPLLRSRKRGGEIVREAPSRMHSPPDLGGWSADAGSAQERKKGRIKDLTEEMGSADRVYPGEAATRAMKAETSEAEAAIAAASEETETGAGVHSAQASRCVAGAPVIYGIEALMDGSAFEECLEDAQAAISSEIENEDAEACAGTTHAPPRSSRRMPDEAIYGIEAIMDGSAFEGSLEDAQAAISSEMENEDAEPCAGTTHAPRRSSRRMPDEAELQRLQQEQQERRRRTDMLSHLRLCPHRPRKHCFEKRLEGAERLADTHLRARVTIPATVEQDPNAQALIDSAMSLPRIHCAFAKCTASSEEDFAEEAKAVREIDRASGCQDDDRHAEAFWDRVLKAHILRQHKDLIQDVALAEEDDDVWEVYKEGLAVQERRRVPVVGAAVDRRAFETTLEVYNDETIRSLICFVCARVCLHTAGAHSTITYKGGAWLLTLPRGTETSKATYKERKTNRKTLRKSTERVQGRAKQRETRDLMKFRQSDAKLQPADLRGEVWPSSSGRLAFTMA